MKNKPEIPSATEDLTNNSGFITEKDIPKQVNADWDATEGVAKILNKPEIPVVPRNVGEFNNDVNYITKAELMDMLAEMQKQIDSLKNESGNAEGETEKPEDGKPCPGTSTVKDFDGNTYATVQIGKQCWMKENLMTTRYADGTKINPGYTYTSTTEGYWYFPEDDATLKGAYGLLYNWKAVMRSAEAVDSIPSGVQGVCPTGWHVPSQSEWQKMFNYVSSVDKYYCAEGTDYAKSLASTEGWISSEGHCDVGYNPSANNATGFSALPVSDQYTSIGRFATFWSSSMNYGVNKSYVVIAGGDSYVMTNSCPDHYAMPVRCIKDAGEGGYEPEKPAETDAKPCPGHETLKDVDGNTYHTVQIGNSCWMKENLRTTRYGDGTEISLGKSISTYIPYRYCPGDDANKVEKYGYLYNFKAVMGNIETSSKHPSGVQGICPDGWHVPSSTEWYQMEAYVNRFDQYLIENKPYTFAKAMAAKEGWDSCEIEGTPGNNPSENNAMGFSILPAGYYPNDGYGNVGQYACFWTTNKYSSTCVDFIDLSYNYNSIDGSCMNEYSALSVRCVLGDGELELTPIVTTAAVTNVTENSASCGGEVTAEGSSPVTARGICWSTSPYPTIEDNHTNDGSGKGSFVSRITNLKPAIYFVRAYATSLEGTSYGEQIRFTTTDQLVDGQPCKNASTVKDIDNNTYNTVQIGNQCWMKENLRTTRYADGTEIEMGGETLYNLPYRYYPNKDVNNVATYGYLYNWNAVLGKSSPSSANPSGAQGICPEGWHVPSYAEWAELRNYVSSSEDYVCNNSPAKALAATENWSTSNPRSCTISDDLSSNNITGFSALPAGYCRGASSFSGFGTTTQFWSITNYDEEGAAYELQIYSNSPNVYIQGLSDLYGISVRCLKD